MSNRESIESSESQINEFMHYKNGREVKVGDHVVGKDWAGRPFCGIVVKTTPGADACNIGVIPCPPSGIPTYTAGELVHIEDAMTPHPQASA